MTRRDWMVSSFAAASPALGAPAGAAPVVDFRYAPKDQVATYCLPDDPHKSLISHTGALLIGHPGKGNAALFPVIVEFGLAGMGDVHVAAQKMEAPRVPIVHTKLARGAASIDLVTFATRRQDEGRVDNVIVRSGGSVVLRILTRDKMTASGNRILRDGKLFLAASCPLRFQDLGSSYRVSLNGTGELLLRLPQQGQEKLATDGASARLEEARAFWRGWTPFTGGVEWKLPNAYMDFLEASSRNILQAREERDGRLTFQVGPTCYRGLWVVDGNFILESARYLGYHQQALAGLDTTWSYQKASGAVTAGGGEDHLKDTAIAMFSTVRQAELSQRPEILRHRIPEMRKGLEFLKAKRIEGRKEDSPVGRYGLHPMSMGDGGLRKCNEFTNALWTMAGVGAVCGALPELADFAQFRIDYASAFRAAAKAEMRRHPKGFDFLPMCMKDDPLWSRPPAEQPKLQCAQWALSQAIFPGTVFEPADPIVTGHIRLMQASTREDVPVETGWIWDQGLWTYNAPFVSHVYLWAGEADWARRTFHGFLNHASPLWCWREEQPLQDSALANYVGDMPHNWASAECVLYLRHMLAMEDGARLRLLGGIGAPELRLGGEWAVRRTPSRFGDLDIELEAAATGARVRFRRGEGQTPRVVELPEALGGKRFKAVKGATAKSGKGRVGVDPGVKEWVAEYA